MLSEQPNIAIIGISYCNSVADGSVNMQQHSDGRELSATDQEGMRLKRTQEKNRRNQRRFRARQRVRDKHTDLLIQSLRQLILQCALKAFKCQYREHQSIISRWHQLHGMCSC